MAGIIFYIIGALSVPLFFIGLFGQFSLTIKIIAIALAVVMFLINLAYILK